MEGKLPKKHISNGLFESISKKAEEKYKLIAPTYCPYLKDKVNFNARGLDHIRFKAWNRRRSRFDQFTRLKLIPLAPKILSLSHTVQGKWCRKEWQRVKRHGRWEKHPREVVYFEFVAVINNARAKVIVKEIVGGQKFFWSLIPFWRMNEITKARKLYDSDIENDGNFTDDIED
jgi:hypothetical protein